RHLDKCRPRCGWWPAAAPRRLPPCQVFSQVGHQVSSQLAGRHWRDPTGHRIPPERAGPAVTTTNSTIFISYRAGDSRGYAALLYLELSRCFGHASVFLDCESIPAGADCDDLLLRGVRRARM